MRQFRASQHSPQGMMSLHMRFIGKMIFMKGIQNSSSYLDRIMDDMRLKGATVQKGNGGWIMVDIIRDNEEVKLGAYSFNAKTAQTETIENILFSFFKEKYSAAKFIVQEVK